MSKYYKLLSDCEKDCDLTKCQSINPQIEMGVCLPLEGERSEKYTLNADEHLIKLIWEDNNQICNGASQEIYDYYKINTCIKYLSQPDRYFIYLVTETPSAISSIDKLN